MGKVLKWLVLTLAAVVVVILVAAIGFLMWFHIPQNASGMAAQTVCAAKFVAGRDQSAEELMQQDVLPASGVLKAISTTIDEPNHSVSSTFLGLFKRQASLQPGRGCVLDTAPDPAAQPYTPAAPNPAPWPQGDAPLAPTDLVAAGVDSAKLSQVLDQALVGSGDPQASNARGIAVVQGGKLLAQRDGQGIAPNTALHGWSMTKTVAAMLAYKRATETGFNFNQPVVTAFPAGRAPAWVAEWAKDDRAKITVADLIFMRDGLKITEGYDPWGDVIQMLYGEPDMSGWAASHPLEVAPGTRWQYLSATSNILAAVTKGQFATDDEYVAYSKQALFDPIGLTSATLQTDTSGTWVGSSYLWASVGDWARLGQLMLKDGNWNGTQVFPPGWVQLASTPAMSSGAGHGYGAQTWLPGIPNGGECSATANIPPDTMLMEGHWGQVVAMVPSRDAVIVRLGWTFNKGQFVGCPCVGEVRAALPQTPAAG